MPTFGISFYSLVVLDSLCEAVGCSPRVELTLGVAVLLALVLLSTYNELNYEENKLEVRLFDKLLDKMVKFNSKIGGERVKV